MLDVLLLLSLWLVPASPSTQCFSGKQKAPGFQVTNHSTALGHVTTLLTSHWRLPVQRRQLHPPHLDLRRRGRLQRRR